MTAEFSEDRSYAKHLDAGDPLATFRDRFILPKDSIYFLGNSLGPPCRGAIASLERVLSEWKAHGVGAWTDTGRPWVSFAERLGSVVAGLIGARPEEVVVTGTTTINLHTLVSTFYEPQEGRSVILADALTFPSDIYALESQVRLRGYDPRRDLVLLEGDGRELAEDDVIAAMGDDIALILLPSILFRSGQKLDVARVTKAARERGIVIGWDCSHSVGVTEHRLDEWGVDFAFFCTYKYLNGGPGASACLYVAERHFDRTPGLAGWFGYRKDRQFEMRTTFEHERSAGGWQISSPSILSMAPLEGALSVTAEAGIPAIRRKSVEMTSYAIDLVDRVLAGTGVDVGSPRDPMRRGGHVALEHEAHAKEIYASLAERGVIVDFRPPNVIRFAPSPLFNTFDEIWRAIDIIADVMK